MFPIEVMIRADGLRAKREAMGISRLELALMTGIHPTALGKIEVGVVHPDQEQRTALMRSLNAGFEEVFRVLLCRPRDHRPEC
jgi:DNA-binding XRE family transcriptional regulator